MTGVEYSNRRVEYTFASYAGILKRHDILINLIPSQNNYGQAIDWGNNLVHGTIGTMSWCNNLLGSLRVNLFVWIGLKRRLIVQVGLLSSYNPLKVPYHIDQLTQHFVSLSISHCIPSYPGSMLEKAFFYSCLGVDQTMTIWIKSQEQIVLVPHALWALFQREYTILVRNTSVILFEGNSKK